MDKKEIERLSRGVTLDEYHLGRDMFTCMKQEGIPSSRAAAMCYHAGYEDGRRIARQQASVKARRQQARRDDSLMEALNNCAEVVFTGPEDVPQDYTEEVTPNE